MLIAEFTEQEEAIFQQAVEWLSCNLNSTPTLVKQQTTGFVIDPFTRIFTSEKGEETYLTAKEFDLLYFLYCHKGQVFSKEQLYESVWGYDSALEGSNLTSFIRKLRKKIEPDPDNPQYILTVWGVGYKFSKEKP
ncbi:TPA: winged helix-turn-helix transcriptional regulator [Clostridioides difficile]|nr:winged helix-turn-helix transcriptional regulator [Clostridioides difficile]